MNDKIKLGQLAWSVDNDLVDAKRVAHAMSDSKNIQSEIFDRWAVRSEWLKRYAPKLQKKIKGGFRPTSRAYLTKAAEIIKKGLIESKAPRAYWNIYRGCLADEIHETKPNLHELLSNVEVSKDDYDDESVGEFFLKAITEHASDFEVYRQDVDWLLECLPLNRPDNWRELIDGTPNFDDLAQLKVDVALLKKKMDKQLEINDEAVNLLQSFISTKQVEELLRNESKAIAKQLAQHASEIKDQGAKLERIDERHGAPIREIKETVQRLSDGFSEHSSQLNALITEVSATNKDVESLGSAHQVADEALKQVALDASSLREEIFDRTTVEPKNISLGIEQGQIPHQKERFVSPFSARATFANRDERQESDSLSFPEFLSGFISRGLSRRLNISEVGLRAICCLITGSPLVVTSDKDIVVTWLEELGSLEKTTFRDVSPLWTEPHMWLGDQEILAGHHEGKRFVVLSEYDEGLTETYLRPVLKSWARSDYVGGMGKLILVRASGDPSARLQVPHVNLDAISETELKLNKEAPRFSPGEEIASFEGQRRWINNELQLEEKAENFMEKVQLVKDSGDTAMEVDRVFSSYNKLLQQCYEMAVQSGFTEASAERLILDTVER